MKKAKGLILFSTLLFGLALVGCTTSNSSQTDEYEVSFIGRDDAQYQITVEAGKSIEEVLTEEDKEELDDITGGSDTSLFEGWYTTSYAASILDETEYFDFSTKITAELSLFAGFVDTTVDTQVSEFVEIYLGIYEEFDVDPFPSLDVARNSFTSLNNQGNEFVYSHVPTHNYERYKKSLVNTHGFTEVEDDKYLSKKEVYYVNLSYNSSTQQLTVELEYNNTVGKFPSYLFSSTYYGIDTSYYITESDFTFADNVNTSDEDRYQTYITTRNNTRYSYIFFNPSSNYYEVIEDIEDYFVDTGLFTYSSSLGCYVDSYGSGYLLVDYVTESEVNALKSEGLDLDTSMVKIQSISNPSRTTLDTAMLELSLQYFVTTSTSIFEYILGNAYSEIYITYSSSYYYYYTPMYYALGVGLDYLDDYLAKLEEEGWYVNASTSTYTTVSLYSPTREYYMSLVIYDADVYVDINANIVTITMARNYSSFDYLRAFYYNQSRGGEAGVYSYDALPTFSARQFGRDLSTDVEAEYYIIGYGTTLDVFEEYVEALDARSEWVLESSDKYNAVFNTTDGSFTLTTTYRGGNIRVELVYNAMNDNVTLTEASTITQNRLTYAMNYNVLSSLESTYDSMSVYSYYDNYGYHRAVVFYYYSTLSEANNALATLESSIETNLDQYESSTTFYVDTNGLRYYAYLDETSTGYCVALVAYNPGV